MPFKLALIVGTPVCVTCGLLYAAGVPWTINSRIAAVLVTFLLIAGVCERWRVHASRLRRLEEDQQTAVAIVALPMGPPAGLGRAAIAGLPAYKYDMKRCGGGDGDDDCAVCLGEIKAGEVVKQLPACTHLFHEGCVDMWLWSHRTCPVCRSPVDATTVPAREIALLVQS